MSTDNEVQNSKWKNRYVTVPQYRSAVSRYKSMSLLLSIACIWFSLDEVFGYFQNKSIHECILIDKIGKMSIFITIPIEIVKSQSHGGGWYIYTY